VFEGKVRVLNKIKTKTIRPEIIAPKGTEAEGRRETHKGRFLNS